MLASLGIVWFGLASFPTLSSSASPEQWRQRTIYQVLTDRFALAEGATETCDSLSVFCGGSWRGLIGKLDYIQGMGFDSIWISPIVKNRNTNQAYHGYWPEDPRNIDTRFGTEQDLMDLSNELHNRGMYLMVDFVINHFSLATDPAHGDYSIFPNPWNSAQAFHPPCEIDYSNQTSTEWCWFSTSNLGSLPDIYTEKPTIFNPLVQSVVDLISKYNIDGIRLDTAKYVPKPYLEQFQSAVGVLVMGEAADGDYGYVADYQNYIDSTLNYALWYNIVNSIPQKETFDILGYGMYEISQLSRDPTVLGTFLDNHDQPRLASWTGDDVVKDINAATFLFFHSGIPIIYYGFEQRFSGAADPNNREKMWPSNYDTSTTLYQYIAKLQRIRAVAAQLTGPAFYTQSVKASSTSTTNMVFERGNLLLIINNLGTSGSGSGVTIDSSQFSRGDNVVDLISCQTATVTGCSGGFSSAAAAGNAARIWTLSSNAAQFELCTNTNTKTNTDSDSSLTSIITQSSPTNSTAAQESACPSTKKRQQYLCQTCRGRGGSTIQCTALPECGGGESQLVTDP